MFLEIMVFVLMGIFAGFLTGMLPGLHPNTVFYIVMSFPFLMINTNPYLALAFIISLAVSNTFFDFIPSILLGAPEEDSVLSVLPGHKFLLEGRGCEAIFLTTVGGVGVMVFTVLALPFMFFLIPSLYSLLRPGMHVILAIVVFWMIYGDRRRMPAFIIFFSAGLFGLLALNSFPSGTGMFAALTGLFGLSTIFVSIMTRVRIPEQRETKVVEAGWARGVLTGWLAGMIAGLLPGIGSSQSGVIASQFTRAKLREFLVALGGINTSNIFFTFVVFYVIGKTRSGAALAVSQIMYEFTLMDVNFIIVVGLMSCFFSAVATVKTGNLLVVLMRKINYACVMIFTFSALLLSVLFFTGIIGFMISLSGMALGVLSISLGVKRTHLMGFLILPTILYFSGHMPLALNFLW